jgi:hypothetical protein
MAVEQAPAMRREEYLGALVHKSIDGLSGEVARWGERSCQREFEKGTLLFWQLGTLSNFL